ncbi:MAG: hypothetical protein IPJ65_11365 [Archangiaceae bacterium]|nr:hypothetical protein [Archangiaceae bacterium]
MTRLLVSFFALTFSSCGVLAGSAHCTFANHNRCQERLNTLDAVAFKATCKAAQGVDGDGACPDADKVGGCDLGKQGDGSPVHDWYYAPKTRADAMSECGSDPFLEP